MELGLNLDSKIESKTLKSGKNCEKQSITSMVSRLNMWVIFLLDCSIYNFEKVFPSHLARNGHVLITHSFLMWDKESFQ